ncbi:hypothetical protein I302_105879 [Kwoniella bestiolae CBS 10118]|uniref:WSC domain-containing protein n=1 Tax=Kwoniella bestiolae CBS 10118 TaxID=1296100 RepID=A0A1B9G2F4_9TREE|nr:hypothetical protein I302_05004 [Kwoniella bestiolae CBS 10118]OCF25191.1 hypothetical protein I302_05004 [Kwoniella bestiolae CBS 10118]
MHSLSVLLQTLAVVLLLPLTLAAPAPDSIFLLQSSTFTPLGCSSTFHPTSILRQVPSPFACFSRCSDKSIAAYSQLQSGVLCACGEEDMLDDIENSRVRCRDNTWFLFKNNHENTSTHSEESTSSTSSEETLVVQQAKSQKRDRLMPFMMMRKKSLQKVRRTAPMDHEIA